MTKLFSIFSLLILASFSVVASPLSVHAQNENTIYVVTASRGLNLRNAQCGSVNIFKNRTVVSSISANSPRSITCTINGRLERMIAVGAFFNNHMVNPDGPTEGFAAERFLSKVRTNRTLDYTRGTYTVNAQGGLNLRTADCKRIATVANGTQLPLRGYGGSVKVCEVRGEFYEMTPVVDPRNPDEFVFVALSFLK